MGSVLHAISGLSSPWAYVLIAALACAESAAFVGLVIPGETALLLGGFLAATGRVSLTTMIVAAAVGAIVGDSAGYEIGRQVGPAVRRSRLGRRIGESRWARAEAYLARHGGRAVFLGRWVGLLRALVPTLAGMTRLPFRTFLAYNVAGGLTWAPTFVLLGYAAGDSYQQLHRLVGRASLALACVLGVLVTVAWMARQRRRRQPPAPTHRDPAALCSSVGAGAVCSDTDRAPALPAAANGTHMTDEDEHAR